MLSNAVCAFHKCKQCSENSTYVITTVAGTEMGHCITEEVPPSEQSFTALYQMASVLLGRLTPPPPILNPPPYCSSVSPLTLTRP